MKFLIQIADDASVKIDNEVVGQIDSGFLVFIGVTNKDTKEIADKMLKKLINLRIFPDENGKTNLSIKDVKKDLLLVSQFTLYADTKHGNRPSFINAGDPKKAEDMYNYIVDKAKNEVKKVETGKFGADMEVSLKNMGPFTIMLDSKELGFDE